MTAPRKMDAGLLRKPTLTVDKLGRRWVGLPTEHRLIARLLNTDRPDECWVWSGRTNEHGYGQIAIYGRRIALAHRVAYILHHGVDPSPLAILHRCDNPPCCNPAHLFAGTQADNVADMYRKGRSCATLADAKVREIRSRAAEGESLPQIAQSLGISRVHVWRIVNHHSRKADSGNRVPYIGEVAQ